MADWEVEVAIEAIKYIRRRQEEAKAALELARIAWTDAGRLFDGIVNERMAAENKLLALLNKTT